MYPIGFLGNFNANQEVAAKVNILQNGCKELGLEVNEFQIANYGDSARQSRLFQVTDNAQPILGDKPKSPIDVEEFLEDFKHYRNSFSIAGRDKAERPHYDNTQEPKEVWSGKPRNQFTSEQREYLDKIKSLAVDVEYEEIQS